MHRSFLISEEERKNILKKHINATSNSYLGLNEQEEEFNLSISVDDVKDFLEDKKDEIDFTIEKLRVVNFESKKREVIKIIDSIEEYIKNLDSEVFTTKKMKELNEDFKDIKKIFEDLKKEGFNDEMRETVRKEFMTNFSSIYQNLLSDVKKMNLKGKIRSSKID